MSVLWPTRLRSVQASREEAASRFGCFDTTLCCYLRVNEKVEGVGLLAARSTLFSAAAGRRSRKMEKTSPPPLTTFAARHVSLVGELSRVWYKRSAARAGGESSCGDDADAEYGRAQRRRYSTMLHTGILSVLHQNSPSAAAVSVAGTGEGVSGVAGAGVSGVTGDGVSGVTGTGVSGATGNGASGVTGAGTGAGCVPPEQGVRHNGE